MCVPDDLKAEVPSHVWLDRPDVCAGCRALDTPWGRPAHDGLPPVAVSGAVVGYGPNAEYHNLDMIRPGDVVIALFHSDEPVAAFRIDYQDPCGRLFGTFSSTGQFALTLSKTVPDAQDTLMRPVAALGELMGTTTPIFHWPATFIHDHIPVSLSYSSAAIVEALQGRAGVADLATGKPMWFDSLPGLLPGQYADGFVVGDNVFVRRFDDVRVEWWVSKVGSGIAKKLVGGPGVDIEALVASPEWIVWTEGSDPAPEPNPSGRQLSRRWDIYRAPFTTDPAQLVPELLVPDVEPVGIAELTNGWFVGTFAPMLDTAKEGTLIAVRVADGHALSSTLPAPYAWGPIAYVTTSEVWGGLDRHDGIAGADTILRMPLSAMTVLQDQADAGP